MQQLLGATAIEAVTFDLDDTLLDDRGSTRAAVELVCSELVTDDLRLDGLVDRYIVASSQIWSELGAVPSAPEPDQAAAIRFRVWAAALEMVGVGDDGLAREAAGRYARARRETYRLFPDVEPVLRVLGANVRMAILANGVGAIQHEKIERTGLSRLINHAIVSGEVGVGKPDRRFFELALRAIGTAASQSVHVGDSLTSDVVGARDAGLTPVWLDRGGAVGDMPSDVHLRITSLAELPALVIGSGPPATVQEQRDAEGWVVPARVPLRQFG